MPLPSDEKVVALANDLLAVFDTMFGVHPGFRPAHAKGLLLEGTFTPVPEAGGLTRAPHANRPSTPVFVRFSNSTGLPALPDTDANANPRGMAIRFMLGERQHTDIISHSVDGFPTHTAGEFLEMLRAAGASAGSTESPTPIMKFLGAHPAALQFVQTPKPHPSSFARQSYFGVTAMQFTNADGVSQFGRYRLVPVAGVDLLSDDKVAGLGENFLSEEIQQRLAAGPVAFDVLVQLADEGDVVDDATIHWPAERPVVTLGRVEITGVVADGAAQQQYMIFDPIPRVDGIEPSADPLLELRAAIYLISGRRRRAAEEQ
ncbi:MAG: catalase family peroxidase [Bryobacteraceae bacterium]|nr:catalase family peroxidase [Bryobacteraceae bacterium]